MTFAVLPIKAPQDDLRGANLARALGETIQRLQEARALWARVVPQPMVQQTVVKPAGVRQLGETLGAHFLLRGNLILAADGYTLDLAVIDTDTERALATKALVTEAGPEPTIKRNQINDALADLTYRAMQEEVARTSEAGFVVGRSRSDIPGLRRLGNLRERSCGGLRCGTKRSRPRTRNGPQ